MKNQEQKHKINFQIRNQSIRIVGSENSDGVYNFREAIDLAKDLEVDLVELSEVNNQSICKLIDYKKFLYQQKQKEKEKKNSSQELKEIRLSPDISDHDIEYRVKQAKEFLSKNDRLRLSLQFKGRQMNFKERGELVLLKFIEALIDCGTAENLPKLEGKKMFCVIKPKK